MKKSKKTVMKDLKKDSEKVEKTKKPKKKSIRY